ncbi:MAG: hypothetical protein FWG64_12365 [Firmicutes bacterium]|nr:hypothetical protein [Bacillota bacterium]
MTIVKANDQKTALLAKAHNAATERNRENRKRKKPQVKGVVKLSNTDSLGRAARVKRQLSAKLGEIMASDLEDDVKKALASNVQMQIDRVEQTVRQIKRRKRAEIEEKTDKARKERNKQEEQQDEKLRLRREESRRRRRRELQKSSIAIRQDFLVPAEKGGFNPNDFNLNTPNGITPTTPAATFDIAGQHGVISDVATTADLVDISL